MLLIINGIKLEKLLHLLMVMDYSGANNCEADYFLICRLLMKVFFYCVGSKLCR